MPQSSAIFAFLAVAFLIFITQRGELPTYLNFLFNPSANTPPAASPQVQGQSNSNGIAVPSWLSNVFGGMSNPSNATEGFSTAATLFGF
jgi:hypothetical protein